MKTEKKNQHYVPKFYLRNFSFQSNLKEIGVYNIFNKRFVQRGKLKTQASKNFFYGEDGVIEDELANIEGDLSALIKEIISDEFLPNKGSEKHIILLVFVSITDARNPVRIDATKNMFSSMHERILELDANADTSEILPQLNHEDHVKLAFSMTPEIINNLADLDYKLLINNSQVPFITSDYPIIKYNQFLEIKGWPSAKTGYGTIGLQIFIPLSPQITIAFYDSAIYKIGDKKKKTLILSTKEDVDQLNVLHFINCFGTIYFDHQITEQYLRHMHEKATKFERANKSQSEVSYLIKPDDNEEEIRNSGKRNLIILNNSDCETKLKVNGIKIHSKGKYFKLNPTMSQLRKHPENLKREEDRMNDAANTQYAP